MRILIVKGSRGAGLGDHLRALNYAVGLSMCSRRTLCIDWRDTPYCNEETNLFDALFDPPRIDSIRLDQLPVGRSITVCPEQWQNSWRSTFSQVHNERHGSTWDYEQALLEFQSSETEIMGPCDVAVVWSAHRKGEGSIPRMDANHLATHMRPNTSIQEHISTFISHHFTDKMIGIHVRMSNEERLGMKSAPLHLYLQEIQQLKQILPGAGIFLATDNIDVIDFFQTRFERVCVSPKWMPAAGQAIHLAAENRDNGIKIAQEAMIDLLLLARCDWIIYPKESSFSTAATLFSDPNKSNLISLEAWNKAPAIRRVIDKINRCMKRNKTNH